MKKKRIADIYDIEMSAPQQFLFLSPGTTAGSLVAVNSSTNDFTVSPTIPQQFVTDSGQTQQQVMLTNSFGVASHLSNSGHVGDVITSDTSSLGMSFKPARYVGQYSVVYTTTSTTGQTPGSTPTTPYTQTGTYTEATPIATTTGVSAVIGDKVSPSVAGFSLLAGFTGYLRVDWLLFGCQRTGSLTSGNTYKFPSAFNALLVWGTLPSGWSVTPVTNTEIAYVTETGAPNQGGLFTMGAVQLLQVTSSSTGGPLPFDIKVSEDASSKNTSLNSTFLAKGVSYVVTVLNA